MDAVVLGPNNQIIVAQRAAAVYSVKCSDVTGNCFEWQTENYVI